jgi:hypothetical protein
MEKLSRRQHCFSMDSHYVERGRIDFVSSTETDIEIQATAPEGCPAALRREFAGDGVAGFCTRQFVGMTIA